MCTLYKYYLYFFLQRKIFYKLLKRDNLHTENFLLIENEEVSKTKLSSRARPQLESGLRRNTT